jgi:hypothetical protein
MPVLLAASADAEIARPTVKNDGDDALAAAWREQQATQHASTSHLRDALERLRARYAVERRDIIAASAEHVADARGELEAARGGVAAAHQRAELLHRQLRAFCEETLLSRAAQGGPPRGVTPDSVAIRDIGRQLAAATEAARATASQTQLLLAAVAHDRVRRDARSRDAAEASAQLELRVRHLEEENASLRHSVASAQAANGEALLAARALARDCRPDPAVAYNARETAAAHGDIMAVLRDVHGLGTALQGRLDALDAFAHAHSEQRLARVAALEGAMRNIEAAPHNAGGSNVFRPRVDAGWLAAGAAAGSRCAPGAEVTREKLAPGASGVFRHRVAAFYRRYNPAKLPEVDRIVAEYAGAEHELMHSLEAHYRAEGYFSNDRRPL